MNDDCFLGGEHAVEVGHRRIERKEIVEFERRRLAGEAERAVATQRRPIGISNRGDRGETVKCSAQHDCQKPGIAPLGAREFWQEGPRRLARPS